MKIVCNQFADYRPETKKVSEINIVAQRVDGLLPKISIITIDAWDYPVVYLTGTIQGDYFWIGL